ncbi:hypothetical protein [Phenylobacterium deserti]|uniref:DNA-binding protein n=1 Tax=Phenylobacterium deserti TaxID=1914756 RepID=A0A328ABR5_9CAUL|nr:hypothetical protein [Phenylobacterium deserti]RAK52091.1 hypothetical protein DJ018_13125 [Phenylobacterium deserti]
MSDKLAYTVAEVVARTPWKKTKIYEMMASGELPWRSQHGHRYVMHDDLMAALLRAPVGVESNRAA